MEKFTPEQLMQYTLGDVRRIAQILRVPSATTGRKEDLIERIMKVQNGEISPSYETRGKKPNDLSLSRFVSAGVLGTVPVENPVGLRNNLPQLAQENRAARNFPIDTDDDGEQPIDNADDISKVGEDPAPAVLVGCTDSGIGQGVLEIMP